MGIDEIVGENEKNKRKIEWIVDNGSSSKLKKVLLFPPAVYIAGTMPHSAQEYLHKRLGKWFAPRILTSINAGAVGILGVGILQTYGLIELGDFTKDLLGGFSDWLDISYKTLVSAYGMTFGITQSIGRLLYTNTDLFNSKGKGAFALGLEPIIWNSPFLAKWSYNKIKNSKQKQ